MTQTYLDFVIEIGTGDGLTYPVAVRSPGAGEARTLNSFPFTNAELENHLLKVENAPPPSPSPKPKPTPTPKPSPTPSKTP